MSLTALKQSAKYAEIQAGRFCFTPLSFRRSPTSLSRLNPREPDWLQITSRRTRYRSCTRTSSLRSSSRTVWRNFNTSPTSRNQSSMDDRRKTAARSIHWYRSQDSADIVIIYYVGGVYRRRSLLCLVVHVTLPRHCTICFFSVLHLAQ